MPSKCSLVYNALEMFSCKMPSKCNLLNPTKKVCASAAWSAKPGGAGTCSDKSQVQQSQKGRVANVCPSCCGGQPSQSAVLVDSGMTRLALVDHATTNDASSQPSPNAAVSLQRRLLCATAARDASSVFRSETNPGTILACCPTKIVTG